MSLEAEAKTTDQVFEEIQNVARGTQRMTMRAPCTASSSSRPSAGVHPFSSVRWNAHTLMPIRLYM